MMKHGCRSGRGMKEDRVLVGNKFLNTSEYFVTFWHILEYSRIKWNKIDLEYSMISWSILEYSTIFHNIPKYSHWKVVLERYCRWNSMKIYLLPHTHPEDDVFKLIETSGMTETLSRPPSLSQERIHGVTVNPHSNWLTVVFWYKMWTPWWMWYMYYKKCIGLNAL